MLMPTVLVADDDPAFRSLVRSALTEDGYEVLEASDGDAAVELLAAAADGAWPRPHVVLLDLRMRGLSALGVLQVLRTLEAELPPTLVVTASRDRSIDTVAGRLGAAGVLRKPLDGDAIRSAVLDVGHS
jgi:CheY-like chemotaxis protein